MIDWKPIATAPKDGRDLLLWVGRPCIGSWRKDDGFSGNKKKLWLADDYDDFSTGYASTPITPTHWSEVNEPNDLQKEQA